MERIILWWHEPNLRGHLTNVTAKVNGISCSHITRIFNPFLLTFSGKSFYPVISFTRPMFPITRGPQFT